MTIFRKQRCAIVLIKSELNFNYNKRIEILIDFHFSTEIEQLKILLGKYEEDNKNILQQVNKLSKENTMLKQENDLLKKENNGIEKIFTKNQRIAIQNPLKKKFWNKTDIANAISLRTAGPQAYRWLLKNNFPYPAESTLRRWIRKINTEPGILSVEKKEN